MRTCGHNALWKVGVGDLTKQLTILHNIGRACGLTYVHTPLASTQRLRQPHRGSTRVEDIDVDGFLDVGHAERSVRSLPAAIRTQRVTFHEDALDDALGALTDCTNGLPCLLVLCFSYELLNSPAFLAAVARGVGAPPLQLRATTGLGLARKYAMARARDGFSCGWRDESALRVAVHVRRGDRAWVEHGGTLYCMHPGLWTALNLGKGRPLDGTILIGDAEHARHADGMRRRAPSAELFVRLVELLQRCVSPVLAMGEVGADAHGATRGLMTEVAEGGMLEPAPAPRLSRTPARCSRPCPKSGEHTEEVLGGLS